MLSGFSFCGGCVVLFEGGPGFGGESGLSFLCVTMGGFESGLYWVITGCDNTIAIGIHIAILSEDSSADFTGCFTGCDNTIAIGVQALILSVLDGGASEQRVIGAFAYGCGP